MQNPRNRQHELGNLGIETGSVLADHLVRAFHRSDRRGQNATAVVLEGFAWLQERLVADDAEAAHFLGVPDSTFRSWAKGYVRRSDSRPDVRGEPIVTVVPGQRVRSASVPFVGLAVYIGVMNGTGTACISSEAAQRLTCDCEVHRILIDSQGLPLDVGRTMRTFPPHLRKALVVRDKGCVFPGCDKPPGWAEAHHIVHWSQGGKTSLNNAALLCSKHHHQVHSEGHQVMIGPDGRGRVLVTSTRLRR